MSTSPPSQSATSTFIAAGALFVIVVSSVVTAFVVLVSARFVEYLRFEIKSISAINVSKVLLPVVIEHEAAQDPQGHHKSASTELSASIDR